MVVVNGALRYIGFMTTEPRLDIIGAALADPSRARILCEMMDGRAFTNKELASAAEITAQTASAHLKHLEGAGLTASLHSGRHVYHRIKNEQVAHVLETLAHLSPTDHLIRAKHQSTPDPHVLHARSCYNHIAGKLGVLICRTLIAKQILVRTGQTLSIGPQGPAFFTRLNIEIPTSKAPIVKLCLDWTERRHHLSGPLATQIMDAALNNAWLERRVGSRALAITPLGYEIFACDFNISHDDINTEYTD
jgi:DNA-binding transcriptional ArsR family regulator